MWKNLTDLHTFGINLNGNCKPSPIAQHIEESIPRCIEAIRKTNSVITSVDWNVNIATVIWVQLMQNDFSIWRWVISLTKADSEIPQKPGTGAFQRSGMWKSFGAVLMALDWCLVVFRFGFQSFSSLLQSLLLRTPVNILHFSKH